MTSPAESGRVWCELSVESSIAWVGEGDVSPVELSGRLLSEAPRFGINAQEEVLDLLLVMITRGMFMIQSGEVQVYSLSPVRAEGYTWDPEGNRLSVRAVSALWTLGSSQLQGDIAPHLYASLCRRYYQSVLGRTIEADLQRQLGDWRMLTIAEAEPLISDAVLESFRSLSDRFPAERYQTLVRDLSFEGRDPGDIYERVCREMMSLATRDLLALQASDSRLRA